MKRRSGGGLPGGDLLDLAKSVLAALVMGGVLLPLLPLLPETALLRCVFAVLIGAAVYALCVILLRSEEAGFILAKLRRGAPVNHENKGN